MTSAVGIPYMVAWRLAGKRVVIVGGGSIGTGKVETLLNTGARLVVIDPSPSVRVQELAAQSKLRLVVREFRPTDVFRAHLVVAATGDSPTNKRIHRCGKLVRAVVNAVDEPALCDVLVPAIVRRGPATIAISTNGASPAAARFLREELTNLLPTDLELLIQHAAIARAELRATGRYRYDYDAWRRDFFEPGHAAIQQNRSGDLEAIRFRFVQEFTDSAPRPPHQPEPVGQLVATAAAGPSRTGI